MGKKYVIKCLKAGLTPELIAGRLRTKYDFKIYHETIYKFIYATNNKLQLMQYLLRRKCGRVSEILGNTINVHIQEQKKYTK